jgi:hypothetical protein
MAGLTDENNLSVCEKRARPATISAVGTMRQFTLRERADVRESMRKRRRLITAA